MIRRASAVDLLSKSVPLWSGLSGEIRSASGRIMKYHSRDTTKGSVLGGTGRGRNFLPTIGAVSLTRVSANGRRLVDRDRLAKRLFSVETVTDGIGNDGVSGSCIYSQ